VLPPSSCSRSTTPKQNTLDISGTRTGFLLAFLVVEITIIAVVVIIMDRDLVTKESIFEVIQEEEDIIVVDIAVQHSRRFIARVYRDFLLGLKIVNTPEFPRNSNLSAIAREQGQ
jgi:hypothetical protein